MTILTKPTIAFKKPDTLKSPLVDEDASVGEAKIDVHPPPCPHMRPQPQRRRGKRSSAALLCMTVVALLVAITGSICGLMLYRQYLRTTVHRYQAYCSIPIDIREVIMQEAQEAQEVQDQQLIEQNYREHRVMPLRWSAEPDDVQVIASTDDETRSDEMVNVLREEFDIHGPTEKVRVFENGHTIMFIHDFSENYTGIVDDDRCFLMDLALSFVLEPAQLAQSMERGEGRFEVSPVRSSLRAALPALQQLQRRAQLLADRCGGKPTYRLHADDAVIRKRSAETPKRDYIQFAGNHVQEISIANLAELEEYEKNNQG